MEKLELKHLAPYLPYNLKLKDIYGETVVDLLGISSDESMIKFSESEYDWGNFEAFKPILRPLSDLKTLDMKDNKPLYFPSIICVNCIDAGMIDSIPYSEWDYLVRNHFDVFGLIEKGLAIDINTLKS